MQRQTQLANDLWPLLLPRIQAMISASASSGGGSTGGAVSLAAHDLGGSLHKGTLRNDQAPQFLLTDGTRSLAGSLAVDAGVTVDGVDISAHAADINAHHAKLHAITDAANHSVTGSQYQIVGLTAVNTLGLLTPSASPAANAVVKTDGSSGVTLVDLTVTSDLFMSGYLDFGTDVVYEDASYLQVTGSKAVRFGQNIGNANWTVYNTGGASFGGSVDIIGGGDLTVIGSGAYAGNQVLFADSSGGNVGIMRAPDSQFALDINGPARATYWIGPHALQLKNVLLLAHYDGRAPYETNYSGEPNGHMGQVGTVSGGVIYRPGKFYKAIQLAGPVTNCVTNPSMENDVTGWGVAGGAAVTRMTNLGYAGTCCAKLSGSTNGYTNIVVTSATSANTQYTLSAYVCGTGKFRLRIYDNVSSYRQSSEYTATSEWVRYTYTATFGVGSTDRQCGFLSTDGVEIYFDAVQLEQGAAATPYCDGSLGDGHAWTVPASPHASTSARTEAKLNYNAAGNINGAVGTIMAWVRKSNVSQTNAPFTTSVNGGLDVYTSGSAINVERRNVANAIAYSYAWAAETWVHLAVTWNGTAVALYVNGAQVATATMGAAFVTPAEILIGRRSDAQYNWNGLIDDLCILDRAATANEIRAIYESEAPVFAETSTFSFRPTPKGLIWADDEGLWMRDTAGKPVLGVYGGEAATKNWGSFNLVPGDLLLGNNAVGSSAIWWSRVSGKFGFYGAGSGTPQVEIATDGRLTAGAGKVALDSTGFTAYNASAVETININADGIYMGDGGARTTIASWTSGNRLQWYSAGEIYEATPETYLDDSSVSRILYPLVMRGIRTGNDAALIELAAVRSDTGAGAKIIIGEGFRLKGYFSGSGNSYATNRVVHAIADDVILESTNLQWLGQTTSTGAVGTYAGKIKIRINGTDRYIPYYAS